MFDVLLAVGQPWHQDVPDPDRRAAVAQPAAEPQRRRELAAGDRPVGRGQARLDVEQDEVDGVEQLVLGPHAEEPGRVECGVHAQLLAPLQHVRDERPLDQRLATRQRHPAVHDLECGRAAGDPVRQLVQGGQPPATHLPGVRVVAVQAAQDTAGQEDRQAGAGAVDPGHQLPGVHPPDRAGADGGQLGRPLVRVVHPGDPGDLRPDRDGAVEHEVSLRSPRGRSATARRAAARG